jgi:hypothetical protein
MRNAMSRLHPHLIIRVAILFGDPDEGLFVSVDDLSAMHRFVTNNILPRFARFTAPIAE